MASTFLPINRTADGKLPPVTLADGRFAWERNRRVRQSDIDKHGSRAAALAAMGSN